MNNIIYDKVLMLVGTFIRYGLVAAAAWLTQHKIFTEGEGSALGEGDGSAEGEALGTGEEREAKRGICCCEPPTFDDGSLELWVGACRVSP